MSVPDVSIVICTYNRAASLALTLAAMDAQHMSPQGTWELVLVDNNSTDATRTIIEDFARSARIRVRSVFVGEQGLSRARNAGIAHSMGHVIGFTDDDVDPPPDWVAKIAARMTPVGGPDIVGGRILPVWAHSPPPWLAHGSLRGMLTIMEHAILVDVLDAHRPPCVWGANMAFRREVFDKVGLFDTRRGLQGSRRYCGEDTELVDRALAAGCRTIYDPSIVVWHRIGAERMRLRYLSTVSFQRAAGEARVRHCIERRALLGIPRGPYWSGVKQVAGCIVAAVLRRPDTIQRWLACCRGFGEMWGTWQRQLDKPAP